MRKIFLPLLFLLAFLSPEKLQAYPSSPTPPVFTPNTGLWGYNPNTGLLYPFQVDGNGILQSAGGGGGGGVVTQPTASQLNATVIQGATAWVTNWTQVAGVSILAGAGATGSGSPRVTVAQDSTTVAGLPPGQALAAASVPVVLTASQLGTLTPLTTVVVQGAVAGGIADSGNPVPTGSIYNTSAPTYANGQRTQDQSDSAGNKKVYNSGLAAGEDLTNNVEGVTQKYVIASTYAYSWDVAFGTAATHNSKGTAALLESVHVTNVSNAILYFQIYNSTGSTSGTPAFSWPVPAGTATSPSVLILDQTYFGNGAYLGTGLTWACSTTQANYTGGTAANYNVNLGYERNILIMDSATVLDPWSFNGIKHGMNQTKFNRIDSRYTAAI